MQINGQLTAVVDGPLTEITFMCRRKVVFGGMTTFGA